MENDKKCTCKLCKASDRFRWATISECKCSCHDSDCPIGHDSLCCAYPNGRKSENPHKDLEQADTYKKILDAAEESI